MSCQKHTNERGKMLHKLSEEGKSLVQDLKVNNHQSEIGEDQIQTRVWLLAGTQSLGPALTKTSTGYFS